ncbi:MAG: hypothetical protein POELPBGB_02923 [Bacteroidia bacterium]|nr:hypothetical protein [Bacteroidia bacterium]
MKRVINFLKPGLFPFSLCLILLLFILLYRIFNFPPPKELIVFMESWFNLYGFKLLFFAALFEGVFVIGMYFPGSLAIALSIFTLGKNPLDLIQIGITSYISFMIANILNYYLGRYGYYKFLLFLGGKEVIEKMQNSMNKYGYRTFFFTGFFPNFIAITSVCAGISNLNIYKTVFYQATSLLFWVTAWTITGSIIIKKINLQDNSQSLYILLLIFLWGVFLVIKDYIKKKRVAN